MCGKFTQMLSWSELVRLSDLIELTSGDNDRVQTFTPMRRPAVIHLNVDGERTATPMTWAFTDRKPQGHRVPKHMHARGETVHSLPTFREAFQRRRGIALARTFNEGEEIDILHQDGAPSGKKWTRQWTYRPKDGQPFAMAVIYDAFDVGGGEEYEFVQVTTPANAVVSGVTGRMPLILHRQDWALWLGETHAPIEEVIALIRSFEDRGEWGADVEDPSRKPPQPRKPKSSDKPGDQTELF